MGANDAYTVVTKVEEGYLITPPPSDDRELRLFTMLDGILDYTFKRLTAEEGEAMCRFMHHRLEHYCLAANKELQKELHGHVQDRHKNTRDVTTEQLYRG